MTKSKHNRLFDKYMQIPFQDRGRNFSGCDCWGLVYLIYQNELKVRLPSYGTISADQMRRVVKTISLRYNHISWLPIDPENVQQFDVCVMTLPGHKFPGHVGVLVNKTKMIHTEKGVGPNIIDIDHWTIRERLVAFRRYAYAPA